MAAPKNEVLILTEKDGMRQFSRTNKLQGKKIALVPTMGCLHEGHLSLVKAARELADVVVVSIYVNPTQFAQHEDFGVYPSTRELDHKRLAEVGCSAVFEPTSLYASGSSAGDAEQVIGAADHRPGSHETWIEVEQLQQGLCGKSRPHFFRGVATVVAKLFNIVEPDVALFGKKDYQQWRVLCRMARDLDFAVEVVGLDIVREADGLAMSSRNLLLTPEDRKRARCISQALRWAQDGIQMGMITTASAVSFSVSEFIMTGGGRMDYVEVVDADTLAAVEDVTKQPVLIAVAVFFGTVRLIDNVVVGSAKS